MKSPTVDPWMFVPTVTPWTVASTSKITFFCRHCGRTEYRHAEGHCLFEATTFAYESHMQIARRILEDKILYHPTTKGQEQEIAAFLKQTLEDLKRAGIPDVL